VTGIGKILALTIILETGEIGRFAKVGHFASCARCVDAQRFSNGKKKGANNAKCGNPYLAWAFVEAVNFAIRYSPRIKRFFDRKCARTNKIVAFKACARKLARAPAVPSMIGRFLSIRACGCIVSLSALLCGCSASPLLAFRQNTPAVVLYPISETSLRDGRADFRLVLCRLFEERNPYAQGWTCERALYRLSNEPTPTPASDLPASNGARTVVFVPGILGQCIEESVKPFQTAYPRLEALGYKVYYVSVSGRSSSTANARELRDKLAALRAERRQPLTLVTYSKGTADALEMLVAYPETAGWIEAMISVAGVVSGSPLADRFDDLYERLAKRLPFPDCAPGDGGGVRSLTRETRLAWLASHRLPLSVRFYSLAAMAPAERISAPLRPFHYLLSDIDPNNDGQVLITDALIPGSTLLGYAAADHWAISMPFLESKSALRAFVDKNDFPRDILIEALLRYVEEDLVR